MSETESNPQPGIKLVARVESNPSNRIWVAYVSLCNDYVHVTATAPASSFQTPGSWGSSQGVQLALNGDFFFAGPSIYGDAVGNGMRWPVSKTGASTPSKWYYQRHGWIAFGDDWVEFSHTERTKLKDKDRFGIQYGFKPTEVTTEIPNGTQSLVSGFPELVIEGQTYTCPSPTDSSCFPDRTDMRTRHPRSAMGLTEDRKTFILVAVDGRSSASVGMYGAELAALMADLGAYEAFNIDGGGSTAMWVDGQGYVNNPSDGSARSVGNHWGIFAGMAGGKARDPGACFVPGGCYPVALPEAENETFKDLPSSADAFDEAQLLLDAGITNGCQSSPRMFCPKCPITRGQAVTFLVRAAGISTANPPATPTFGDVPTTHVFYPAIEAAAAAGITTGCGDGDFCPKKKVTRGQFAAMTRRTTGWPSESPGMATYGDVPTDHLFYGDIEALNSHCVTTDCGSGNYCPDQSVNRAQSAIFIARAFNLDGINDACSNVGGGGSSGAGASGGTGGNGGVSGGQGGGGAPDAAGGASNSGQSTRTELNDGGCGCHAVGSEEPNVFERIASALVGRR